MRRAIYKGVVVGVLILGIAYFWHEQGELYMDVLRHIPQILFEGYQPAAFDPEVQKKFGIWVLTDAYSPYFCFLTAESVGNGKRMMTRTRTERITLIYSAV